MSRRTFLQGGLLALAASIAMVSGSTPLGSLTVQAADETPWENEPFVGDHWEQCHALRDGQHFPRGGAEEHVEVLVIGGGVSGLVAAYKLMRHHQVIVLEKEGQAGGNSRFATWDGIRYPLGALYYTKPVREIRDFLIGIGLTPTPIAGSPDTLLARGHYVPHFLGAGVSELPYPPEVRRAFKRAWHHFAEYNHSDDAPNVPLQETSRKSLALDRVTFTQYCKDHTIHPQVVKFLDQYVRSCWGVGNDKVSAFGAINFLASEFEPTYAFSGGNGAISDALARHLGRRIRTHCFVDRVLQEKHTVRVDYVRDGKPGVIRARQVIMATPKHITKRMLVGLPAPLEQALGSARYGSYLVGEVCMHEPLADKGFDLWVEDRWYSDLCMADWVVTHGHPAANRKTVMVASIPMGEVEGRAALQTTSHHDFAERLLSEMEKDFPDCRRKVAGIQFARYGHPMVIPYPGYITNVTPHFYRPFGHVWFANSDAHGLACWESAYSAAAMAVKGVRKVLAGVEAVG